MSSSSGKKKKAYNILLICEGYEEVMYFDRLNELNVWSHACHVETDNAHGSGNIYGKYSNVVSSPAHDLVVIVCDTEMYPYDVYEELCRKINRDSGTEEAAGKVVFFCNPCSLQIILSHFDKPKSKKDDDEKWDLRLKTNNKHKNSQTVKDYTGLEDYHAKQNEQLTPIYKKLTVANFQLMLERVGELPKDYRKVPSTNIMDLFVHLLDNDRESVETWIKGTNAIVL